MVVVYTVALVCSAVVVCDVVVVSGEAALVP